MVASSGWPSDPSTATTFSRKLAAARFATSDPSTGPTSANNRPKCLIKPITTRQSNVDEPSNGESETQFSLPFCAQTLVQHHQNRSPEQLPIKMARHSVTNTSSNTTTTSHQTGASNHDPQLTSWWRTRRPQAAQASANFEPRNSRVMNRDQNSRFKTNGSKIDKLQVASAFMTPFDNRQQDQTNATNKTHGQPNQDCPSKTSLHKQQPQTMFKCHISEQQARARDNPLQPHLGAITMKFLSILVISTILSHLNQIHYVNTPSSYADSNSKHIIRHLFDAFPRIIQVAAEECATTDDCEKEKVCHENRCICGKTKPIEDKDRSMCLAHSAIGEMCYISEQCLGGSQCIEGFCSCSDDAISIYNPSTRIHYCHLKRRLNQECSHDAQCPREAFCASQSSGCLCQNGFGQAIVRNDDGLETLECLPKTCASSTECESEYHRCEDNKCKCLATHFDPHTARCYKFGSTGGKASDESQQDSSKSSTNEVNRNATSVDRPNDIYSILKDLTSGGDKSWIVILIAIVLAIIILVIFIMLIRRHCLACCWAGSKIEYEPNNRQPEEDGYFSKNSIRNKSFRQKNGETDGDDTAAVRSNLVTTTPPPTARPPTTDNENTSPLVGRRVADSNSHYVKVNMNENNESQKRPAAKERHKQLYQEVGEVREKEREPKDSSTNGHYYQPFHHQVVSPLASSTSTPV